MSRKCVYWSVSAYLDLAEDHAECHILMTMEDWSKRLDLFLMAEKYFKMQAKSQQRLQKQKLKLYLKSIELFRTDCLCLTLINIC